MSRTAFLVAFGPEVRTFISSGLARRIAGHSDYVLIAPEAGLDQLSAMGLPAVCAPQSSEPGWLRRTRAIVYRVAEIGLGADGYQKWRQSLSRQVQRNTLMASLGAWIFSFSWARRLVFQLKSIVVDTHQPDEKWVAFLRAQKISTLVYSAYCSPRTTAAVHAANLLGIRTILVPNNWKDFFIQPLIDPIPSEVWVWDEGVRRDYLRHNPWLSVDSIKVLGSLQIVALLDRREELSRQEFCNIFGLDARRPVICYTAAASTAMHDEDLLISKVVDGLRAFPGGRRPQVLVRTNPMDESSNIIKALSGMPDVVVWQPDWVWLPQKEWCCPSLQDMSLWASALEHMDVNVSIPSTVTMEALAFDKDVINIGFDLAANVPPEFSCRRFWQSPYYARLHGNSRVFLATSVEECVALVLDRIAQIHPERGCDAGALEGRE